MKPMNSKERVMTALACQEPDRVPVDYAANPGIHARLVAHFGLTLEDGEGLLQALGVDFRGVGAAYRGPRLHPEVEGRRVDPLWGKRTRWIANPFGGYWDFCDFPLKDAGEEQVEAWPMPSPDDYDYASVRAACERHKTMALYVGGAGLGDIINSTGMLRTMEQVLVDLISEDPAGLRLIDRKMEVQLEVTRRTLEAADGAVDFLWMGEDLGSQRSPLISTALYRKHIRPRHQKFVNLAKSFNLPVMVHTCGSSSWAYEDFIEMGINAVDTLQPEAKNMSPAHLKKTFGGRLAFHGCLSTAGAVANGTREDVERDVRETLEVMMPGGGYCLSPTHQLQDNSPTENVVALYEAARAYGQYRHPVTA